MLPSFEKQVEGMACVSSFQFSIVRDLVGFALPRYLRCLWRIESVTNTIGNWNQNVHVSVT
jgi:hypothetical protein